jgi:hypothetical protein
VKKNKYKGFKGKSFSEIPQGALQNPANHPVDNLASRGAVPLGQSGAQMMSPMDANLNQSHPDIPGGGNTGMV